MAVQDKFYTADNLWEYAQRPENADKRFELINGEIIEVTPASAISTMIGVRMVYSLLHHIDAHDLGFVSGADGGFDLGSGNFFAPDTAFVAKTRLPKMPERYFTIAPDLAVEVLSATDKFKATLRKAEKYLAIGTRAVWIVDPTDKEVDICRPSADGGMNVQTIGIDGVLDGGDILPGFTLPVQNIFKNLPE